jgi:hypothetical protein
MDDIFTDSRLGRPCAPRRARWLLIAILLLAAVVRLAVWSRPLEALDGRTLPDDAYLALEIAKNLGQGDGPRYGDAATNGFQPLYVLLAAPQFRGATAGDLRDPAYLDAAVKRSLAITVVADLLCILVLAAILARRLGWSAAVLSGAALWATQPVFVRTCLNGLETSLAMLALLVAWWWLETRCRVGAAARRRLVLGVLLGLGMLARLDLALFAVWAAGIPAWRAWRTEGRPAAAIAWLVPVAAGVVLAYGPWLLYSWQQTGALLPVSGKAVRFMSLANADHQPDLGWYLESLRMALVAVWRNTAVPWIVVAAIVVFCVLTRGAVRRPVLRDWWEDRRWLAPVLLFGASLLAAYAFFLPAYWFFDRYLFPLSLVAVLLATTGLHRLLAAQGRAGRLAVAIAGVAVAAAAGLADPGLGSLLGARYDPDLGYRQIGLWAARTFPEGTTIGSSQTGALAYYAPDLDVVNLDGVVNAAAYRSLVARRHVAYLEERGVEYVLGWDVNMRFVWDHSAPGAQQRLAFRGKVGDEAGRALRSWWNEWLVYQVVGR